MRLSPLLLLAAPLAFAAVIPDGRSFVLWNVDNITALNTSRWPALVRNSAYNVYGWAGNVPQVYNGVTINGGIPQKGNLSFHLTKLARDLKSILPPNASGACLLDYEQWRADFNTTPFFYRNLSIAYALEQNPSLNATAALAAATAQFEAAARTFLEASLNLAKSLFPACRWGLYAYPINDWSFGGYTGPRAASMRAANDNLAWLWKASTALFPSVYLTSPKVSKYDGQSTSAYVSSTVAEAVRLRLQAGAALGGHGPAVFALAWYVYNPYPRPAAGSLWPTLTPSDLGDVLGGAWGAGADAVLVWGAVGDALPFTSTQLANYTDAVLGPAASSLVAAIAACSASACAAGGQCRANNSQPCFCPPPSLDGTCASASSSPVPSPSGTPLPALVAPPSAGGGQREALAGGSLTAVVAAALLCLFGLSAASFACGQGRYRALCIEKGRRVLRGVGPVKVLRTWK